MNKPIFIIALLLVAFGMRAQNFNYTVSADSVSWNELNAQTILNTNNSAWNFSYKIPIGFTFPFAGKNFDSLTIETNGYVVFDSERNYAFTIFSGVGDRIDGSGNHSVLSYDVSGTVGSRILKIQFKDCGESYSSSESQSWQIWLKENGNIEFRVGPGTLRYSGSEIDTTQNYRIGLLNMNMDTADRGFMIGGNPSSPQSRRVNDTYPDVLFLDNVPASGYRYTFSPSY